MAHFIDLGQDIQRLNRLLQDLQNPNPSPPRDVRRNKGANTSMKKLRSHGNRCSARAAATTTSKSVPKSENNQVVAREDWRLNDLVLRKVFGYLPVDDLKNAMLVCKDWRSAGQFQLAERTRIELIMTKVFSFISRGRELKQYTRFEKARETWPLSPMCYQNFKIELERSDWGGLSLPNTLSFFTGATASEIRNLTVKEFDVEVIERLLLPGLLLKFPKIKRLKLLSPVMRTVEERGGTYTKGSWVPHKAQPGSWLGHENTDCKCSFCHQKKYGEDQVKKDAYACVKAIEDAVNNKKRRATTAPLAPPAKRPKTRSVTAKKNKNSVLDGIIEDCFSQEPEFNSSTLESFVIEVDPQWVVPFEFLAFCPRLKRIGIIDGCRMKHRQGAPHGHYDRCLKDASVYLKGKPVQVVKLVFDLHSCKVQTLVDFMKDFDLTDVFYEISGPFEEVLELFSKVRVPKRTAGICYIYDTEQAKVDDVANLTALLHKKGYFDLQEMDLEFETARSWFFFDERSLACVKFHKARNGGLVIQLKDSIEDLFGEDPVYQIRDWIHRDFPKFFPTIRYVCACDPDERNRVLTEVIGEPHQVFNINKLCTDINILEMPWTERQNIQKRTRKNRYVHLIDMPEFRVDANLPDDWCPEWTIGGDMFVFYPMENEVLETVKNKLRGSIRVYNTRKRQARQHHLQNVKVYEGAELKDLEDTL